MSLSTTLKAPFGCMANYHDLSNIPYVYKVMISDMKTCLTKLTSTKYLVRLAGEIRVVTTNLRIAQFAKDFDSFEGEKVRDGPGLRDPTDLCCCDADTHPLVSVSGCEYCCINWPGNVHACPCDVLTLDTLGGRYSITGCMHPGDWHQELVMEAFEEHGLCLVCGVFNTDDIKCEHTDLHDDVNYFEDRVAWAPTGPYTEWLARFLSNDKVAKKKEDKEKAFNKAVDLAVTDLKRKAGCLDE
jgi:hypothetical protein